MFNRFLPALCLTAGLLAGCTPPQAKGPVAPTSAVTPPPVSPTTPITPTTTRPIAVAPVDDTIAAVGTTTVRRGDLQKALDEAYGFNMLMLLVQRELAHDACAQAKINVTPADVKWEYDWTLNRMFQNLDPSQDREKVLDQFLAQPKGPGQTTSRTELAIIIETNAYLRKLVEPSISRAVTDDMLKQQFDETYGTQVQVRHIMTDNLQDAAAAAARVANGEDFATVARQVSRNPETRQQGGALPPFTTKSSRFPENFKAVAFSLKPGEVSSPVQAGGGYHLIKLEGRIDSKVMKFDAVKADLREDYEAKLVEEAVKGVKAKLAQQALAGMRITDPVLKAEFEKRVAGRDQLIRDKEKMRDQMERDRLKAATTGPTTAPATTTAPTRLAPRPASTAAPATTVTPPAVAPPVAPRTAPTTAPVTPPVSTAPVPTPPPEPASRPAPTPASTRAGATVSGIDPLTGAAVPATPGVVRTGVAPVGVIQNGGGFTAPSKLSTDLSPQVAPATRSTTLPDQPPAASR